MKRLSEYLNYIIVAFLLLFAGIYYLERHKLVPVQSDVSPVDVDKVVNKFIKQTAEQAWIEEMAYRKALQKQLAKPLAIKRDEPKQEEIPAEKQIWKDSDFNTPSENVYSEMYQQEVEMKQDEMDKKEYARQYIENARRSGFHVVLSPDNEVISVTPIRKPSQNEDSTELFPAD